MQVAMASLATALRREVAGEVRFDPAGRRLYANDASHFRIVPAGVVTPRSVDDVEAVLRRCHGAGVPVTARGAGTSLAGNAIGPGVVLDLSRHLRRIVSIEPDRRIARVQAGVVLDDLRRAANQHGLTFGPDPSTANRCTIGGMIGNNACGAHSLTTGRTSDNVERIDARLADGSAFDTGRAHALHQPLRVLGAEVEAEVRRRHPAIPRRVSGHNLGDLAPATWDLASFLVGTEGTLAVVVEADLRLVPWRRDRALVAIGYGDAATAADHVPGLRRTGAIALEGIDDAVVTGARHRGAEGAALLPDGRAWLLVEFDGDTAADARAAAERCADLARADGHPAVVVVDPAAQSALWRVRAEGLGAVTFRPGERARVAGWEDAAVAPDRLGDYLRDFHDLVADHDLDVALYGHFGDGCVHTKIDFDHTTPEGIVAFRRFVEAAADLALAHGGSLSGEHGDGRSRSELLERMLGPQLVDAQRRVKALFDPTGILNPGVVVDPDGLDDHLRLAGRRPALSSPPLPTVAPRDLEADVHRCIGMAACRRDDDHGTMCPTYRVTGDEQHTPRGRARLLQEALRDDGLGLDDPGVAASLDACLSCRGCATDCPVDVDVAKHKAAWNARRFADGGRPRAKAVLGRSASLLRRARRAPRLANRLASSPFARLARRRLGLTTSRPLPRLAEQPFSTWWQQRGGSHVDGPDVVLFADTFSECLEPEVLRAAVEVLEASGHRVVVPSADLCCGRPLLDPGMLDEARATAVRTLDALDRHARAGTAIIAVEPSCAAMLADDLTGLFPPESLDHTRAARVAAATTTLAGFLVSSDWQPPRLERRAALHGHCHQRASLRLDAEARLLGAMGVAVEDLDAGCCGLAGGWGFEAEHFAMSVAIGESRLLPAVRALDDDVLLLADGFSCRTQLDHLQSGRRPWHLARLLAAALHGDVPTDEPD